MSNIPNQLVINIRTSIPGYQNIKYSPTMTFKKINKEDNSVIFNPLIPLNQSKIDKIPENYRKKQFFNKSLFQSLLNHLDVKPAKNLFEANNKGYVNNNIKITLDTIFPISSSINIAGISYIIADVQWTNGDWKIDIKNPKNQIDSAKIKNPYLYQSIIQDEIISGEKQLKNLPSSIKYGPSYINSSNNNNLGRGLSNNLDTSNDISNNDISNINNNQLSNNKYNIPLFTNLIVNKNQTQLVNQCYSNIDFYNLIENIYTKGSNNMQQFFTENIKKTLNLTNNEIFDLSNYKSTVNTIKIIDNNGGGDCFFIAVSDAINYYNQYNNEKIIHGIYGYENKIFTPLYLRNLVYNYLIKNPNLDNLLLNIAPVNKDNLNKIFSETLNKIKNNLIQEGKSDNISDTYYLDLVKDIYKQNENFLVNDVKIVPSNQDEYENPFHSITKANLKEYILSKNYWGDQLSIISLLQILNINVIPITIREKQDKTFEIIFPFSNFNKEFNNWDKYLFLLYDRGHYNLISFHDISNILNNNINNKNKFNIYRYKVIYSKKNSKEDLPPLSILFSIFGGQYMNLLDENEKDEFTFLPEIMKNMENTINSKIFNEPNYKNIFYPNFKSFFPKSLLKAPIDSEEDSKGGKNRRNKYNNPYAYSMMKNEKNSDKNQLAYFINIEMQLHSGNTITPEELKKYQCNSKWNNISKSYSNIVGKPYSIMPVYPNTNKNKGGSKKNKKFIKLNTTKKNKN